MITSSCKIKSPTKPSSFIYSETYKELLERPRLAVYRSLKNIYGQIIDDTQGVTLVSMSTIAKDIGSLAGKEENGTEL